MSIIKADESYATRVQELSRRYQQSQIKAAMQVNSEPLRFYWQLGHDFLTIRKSYDEKELKDALMDNLQSFLLELGRGFTFAGREYRPVVGETELFLDMLFYNVPLHCYVVVEVKTRGFRPEDTGQLGTYVASVNHLLKGEGDDETVGLLVCRGKGDVLASYLLDALQAI